MDMQRMYVDEVSSCTDDSDFISPFEQEKFVEVTDDKVNNIMIKISRVNYIMSEVHHEFTQIQDILNELMENKNYE